MNMTNYKKIIIAMFVCSTNSVSAGPKPKPVDLEKKKHDFILETKQIIIPGFPGAFNPSIARWKDSLIMSFRVRNDKLISTFEIGMVWLDKKFNPVGTPTILKIRGKNPSTFSQNQDPRLIVLNNKLFIVYSNFIKIDDMVTKRMFLAEVHYDKEQFFIMNPRCLHPFEGCSKRWEKNWVPFVYNGKLLISYSLLPHRVFKPSMKFGECQTVCSSSSLINWNWGDLRGGTPAVLDGNEYLAFFHSSKKIATTHSHGKAMPHYVMGAYTFSSKPPFEITRISPEPIVGRNFYNGPAYNTWKPLRVVFPMGCLCDKKYVWVTYGRQDFEIWVAKLDKKGLYKSLVPCSTANTKSFELEENEAPIEQEGENELDLFLDNYLEATCENQWCGNS